MLAGSRSDKTSYIKEKFLAGKNGVLPFKRHYMKRLASFFKAPLGVDEHRLNEQFKMLTDYCKPFTGKQ